MSSVIASTLTVCSSGCDYTTIQGAIDASTSGDTINVSAGTYVENGQIVINKNLSIIGENKDTTIIKPNQDTGDKDSGDAKGWFLVNDGITFNLKNVTLDGSGHKIWQAIRHKGNGIIENCKFTQIKYEASGPSYAGTAVVVFGNGNVDIKNCEFEEIGRVGVLYYGTGITDSKFIGNTYTGKGNGDWLDYGVEVGAGAQATIENNTISNNIGVASVDNSTSAGILVTTYYGSGTQATIIGNTISNSYDGIAVGYDASDTSNVTANNNNLIGNTHNGVDSTAPIVDATKNWWGTVDGPSFVGPGSGDNVSLNVNYDPWLCELYPTGRIAYDNDGDSYRCSDCNDTNAAINPAAIEVCDGIDNNCDGNIDEGGNTLCDDGIYCNGTETCAGILGCLTGTPPDCGYLNDACNDGYCNETTDSCEQTHRAQLTPCNSSYFCSNSVGGDNTYGIFDFKSPRQGYCDGFGNCDYTLSTGPNCTLGKTPNQEGTGLNFCQDVLSWCRNTCEDTVDNDGDGLIDGADPDCITPQTIKPVSVINSPAASSWQNKNFPVNVSDSDNRLLDYCQYRVYSNNGTNLINTRDWTNRTCNSSTLIITVGFGMDCRDQGNNTCEVHVKAFDNDTNEGVAVMRLFSIDWSSPSIWHLNPENRSYTNNNKTEISARYYDDFSGIDLTGLMIEVDGVDKTNDATKASSKVSYILSVDLNDGIHNVTVRVNDTAGNLAQKKWLFTVDTVSPVIDIISPKNKTYNTTKISTEINVTNEGVKSLKSSEDGVHFDTLCTYCNYTKKLLLFDQGTTALTIEAEDYAGNKAYKTINFFVDSILPKIIKTLPEDEEIIHGTMFYIKYTEANLMNISLYWKNSTLPYTNVTNYTCVSGTNKECNFYVNLIDHNGETIDFYFEVQDPINVVKSSVKTIIIDNKKPVVTILSPENKIYPNGRMDLKVNVDEKVKVLEYSLDGSRFSRLCRDCENYNQKHTFRDGNHTLVVNATDYAGNFNQSSVVFFVDSTKPRIIRQYPGNRKYTNGTFTVVYTEENLDNITLYYKGIYETKYQNETKNTCELGRNKECNFNVSLTNYNGFNINYYFVVRDHVSETKGREYMVKVDTTIPNITNVYSPINGTNYNSTRVLLNISVSEDVELQYMDNDGRFRRLCSNCDSYDRLQTFSDGVHQLLIMATDKADNRDYEIVNFNVV